MKELKKWEKIELSVNLNPSSSYERFSVKDEYRKFEWKLESNQRKFEPFEDEVLIEAEIAGDEYSQQMKNVFKEAGELNILI